MRPPVHTRKFLAAAAALAAFALSACAGPGAVPTLIPTAPAALPATNTPLPRLGAVLPPTSTPQPTPGAIVAAPAVTVTPVVAGAGPTSPIVSIGNAARLGRLVAGGAVTVSGLAQRNASHSVWVSLLSPDQQLLLDVQADVAATGGRSDPWEATITVPLSTLGPAQLVASIRDAGNQVLMIDPHPVELVLDAALTDRYITLAQPTAGLAAYTGNYLYLAGEMSRPAGGLITMTVLDENCRAVASRQSFAVRSGGGRWYGYVLVPRDAAPGPACAVASFGEPGSDAWRQVFRPITIGDGDDPDASPALHVIAPEPGAVIRAGERFLINGLAYNVGASPRATSAPLEVSVVLENGLSLAQSTGTVDDFGYWEVEVALPPGTVGSAAITIRAGTPGDDAYIEEQLLITIE